MHDESYRWWNFQSWEYFPQMPNCLECQIVSSHMKGILLYFGGKAENNRLGSICE